MSNSNNNNNKKMIDNSRPAQSESSRRRFMRNLATGAAALTFGFNAVGGQPLMADATTTADHINDFMNRIVGIEPTDEAARLFQQAAEQVINAVNTDENSRRTFEAIGAWVDNWNLPSPAGEKVTSLGLGEGVSSMVAAGYLRAISGLYNSKTALTAGKLKTLMANPKNIFDRIETDFVNQLYSRVATAAERDSTFPSKVNTVIGDLTNIGPQISKPGNLEQSRAECIVNGQPAPTWVCVTVIVIVVIVIFSRNND